MTRLLTTLAALASALACGTVPAGPVTIDLKNDTCAHCRMGIVSTTTAAQVVAAGEEPRFFDDIGCLRDYLAGAALTSDAVVFVADHRTGDWIDARRAVVTKTSIDTPMASGLVAHADAASRDADPAAAGGQPAVLDVAPKPKA
jgi:copper chaperone NosL